MSKKKKRDKHSGEKMPNFKPIYVEAFMIMMLHKIGGKQTISVKQLEAFEQAANGKHTEFSYDKESDSITITAPGYEMPSEIVQPAKQRIHLN